MSGNRVINGRAATEEDVHPGGAIFFIPDNRSVPYSFGNDLPISVKIMKPDDGDGFPPPGTLVQILQAELTDDGRIILGFEHDGGDCVCTLDDVEMLDALG